MKRSAKFPALRLGFSVNVKHGKENATFKVDCVDAKLSCEKADEKMFLPACLFTFAEDILGEKRNVGWGNYDESGGKLI